MKTSLVLAGFCGAVMVLASVDAQSARPSSSLGDVEKLTKQVDQLESRVARLEARAGRQNPTFLDHSDFDDPDDAPKLSGRILQLDGIDTIEPEGTDDSEEIRQLRRDIDSHERNVRSQNERLKSMAGQGRRGSSYYSGRGGTKGLSDYDRRSAQAEVVRSYRRELGEKKRELNELEKQLTETKQVIHGHRGDTIITLYTTRDLSRQLGRADIGGYLKWTGRRSSASAGSEEWVVSSVQVTDAP